MIEAYGLALAHLSEMQRSRDEAKARYDRGLATVAVRRPGVIRRIASALFQTALRDRAVRSAAPEARTASCGGCVSPTRVAA